MEGDDRLVWHLRRVGEFVKVVVRISGNPERISISVYSGSFSHCGISVFARHPPSLVFKRPDEAVLFEYLVPSIFDPLLHVFVTEHVFDTFHTRLSAVARIAF